MHFYLQEQLLIDSLGKKTLRTIKPKKIRIKIYIEWGIKDNFRCQCQKENWNGQNMFTCIVKVSQQLPYLCISSYKLLLQSYR